MISTSLEILNFLQHNFSFLFSLITITILTIILRKSIKKHAKIYYWVCGIISLLAFIPVIGSWTGLFNFRFYNIPIIGNIIREFNSMAYMGHPLLVIIMYIGALSTKNKKVAGLMSIRKELSIIVGFPVIAHALKRIMTGVWALGYFFNHDEFMENRYTNNEVAEAIFTSVLVLGFLMFALFLILWITSFSRIRKRMTFKKWKSIQRWSYALYAMIFLQALGLKLGPYINEISKEKQNVQYTQTNTERQTHIHKDTAISSSDTSSYKNKNTIASTSDSAIKKTNRKDTILAQNKEQNRSITGKKKKEKKGKNHHSKRFSLTDIRLSSKTSKLLNMIILLIIYGSYLILRLGKAKKDRQKRS